MCALQGYILNSTIDGCIQMKSYLSGNPPLRLALNEDLTVGKSSNGRDYGVVRHRVVSRGQERMWCVCVAVCVCGCV